ncbi:acyl-CoA desaturase [Chiayiivirga flava]|uniref:Stearoyl-CoA desaturase (Delta-9 desaturase) n=1 Tax=Chiayiivirga flava TaxID=659595 RepID=A0A7W8D3M8_9GAMM|nr:acyl-CoA desaturase [Chiayiivirga flava]MBB5207341.1 stearoyl-CoA desaturase (delta-9 desaturase) [Chiayiivirga flava]
MTTHHAPRTDSAARRAALALLRWFDTADAAHVPADGAPDRVDWLRVLPFVAMHVACLGVFVVGVSWVALAVAFGLYVIRMFAITGFYHRYFSHKAFKTSRAMQLLFALLGAMSVQRGPLWWAAHHRHHHRHADTEQDMHSPVTRGFFWSHMGWFLTARGYRTDLERVRDLARYPELRWLDRFDIFVPIALAAGLFLLGGWLEREHPQLGTSGPQLLVWGFFVSTVVLFHATVTINSLAHRWGSRRYPTADNSRNNWMLALITLGEGWHNNHHHFPGSARQGFRWWEVDATYYLLRAMAWLGLVWDLRPVPANLRRPG